LIPKTIIGVDPGSQITGVGVIRSDGTTSTLIAHEGIATGGGEFPERLKVIFERLRALIDQHTPDEAAIERVFMARNADSAIKLGQARGAAICALVNAGLKVHEYTAKQVKQAVVGKGGAEKTQVQHMIGILLSHSGPFQADAADALAVAVCHAHSHSLNGLGAAASGAPSSWRHYRP
jgi:crossover junction endodeoxyribonuclease RuvC